jgi:hypothetical protein
MSLFSPSFELPGDVEGRLMQFDPSAPEFAQRLTALIGLQHVDAGKVRTYAEAIQEAAASNMPLGKPVLHADDFCPTRTGRCSPASATCATTPTRAPRRHSGPGRRLSRHHRLATRKASSLVTFTLRLMEPFETARQVFSPLLVRFLSGVDHTTRPVKISDSGASATSCRR